MISNESSTQVDAQGKVDVLAHAKAISSLPNADLILEIANVLNKMNAVSSLASLRKNNHGN